MYSSFGGSSLNNSLNKLTEKKAEEKRKEELMKAKVSEENKKIYLIAGAVAVLGSIIVIFKTRKK